MLGAEHAAPGLAEKGISLLDPRRPQQRIEFIEEQVDGPEVRALFWQPGGVAIAELIIVDHGPAIERGDILEGIDIVVRAAWPAMRDD